MVNNYTNINTTNFHLNTFNIIKTMTYDIGNLGLVLGQTSKYGRFNIMVC
jgi:hypothetical protein